MEPRQIVIVALAAVVVAGGGVVGVELFAPERSTQVDESTIGGTAGGGGNETVLATGEFEGKDGHQVSGTVELVRADGSLYLRFIDYEQTAGPDVFIYVTPAADPDTRGEIDAGTKVRIDGGADGGESTKEGTFVQRLPDGVTADSIGGVAAWCDDFGVPFGAATLSR
jgi:hypothetical protein